MIRIEVDAQLMPLLSPEIHRAIIARNLVLDEEIHLCDSPTQMANLLAEQKYLAQFIDFKSPDWMDA